MSYVPNSAMPHAFEKPSEQDEAESHNLGRPRWWRIAGGIGVALAIAAPGVVRLLRGGEGGKSRSRPRPKKGRTAKAAKAD